MTNTKTYNYNVQVYPEAQGEIQGLFLCPDLGGDDMPHKPLKPCKHPNCPELTQDRFCQRHRHQHERISAAQRGYDNRWRKARDKYLKEHPLCVRCQEQGRLTQARVVDHIIPHHGDDKLFWDRSNWQALCKRCHDKKTMTEDKYREYRYKT